MTHHPPWLTWLTIPPTWCHRDTQAAHRTLAYAVDGGPVLWSQPLPDLLIVQADHPIDPESIGAKSARSLPVRLDYQPGEHVALSVIANPTRALARHGERGKVVPITTRAEQVEWITRKLAPALTVTSVDIEPIGQYGGQRHERRVVHLRVGYTVAGTVTDPEALAGLIRDGIGRGRAYGCGLLIVHGERAA